MLDRLNALDRNRLGLIGLVLVLISFLSVNLFAVASFRQSRLDLTADGLFTMTPAMLSMLSSLEDRVTLRLFLSESLLDEVPTLRPFATRVRELLERYAELSDGRIRLEVIDPEPFSPAEDRALGYGLEGIPLGQGGERGYFGLVGTDPGQRADIIPFFVQQREKFLEYDLARLIHNLSNPKKAVIQLIERAGMPGTQQSEFQPWVALERAQQFFDVRVFGGDIYSTREEAQVLWVVHPDDLSETTLYAIDQFVLKGGHAIFFVDPHAEHQVSGPAGLAEGSSSDLERLFKAWGIAFDPSKVVADAANALPVPASRRRPGLGESVPYLPWLRLSGPALAQDDIITGNLEQLILLSAGALKTTEGSQLTLEPLLTSSPQSMLLDAETVRFATGAESLADAFQPGGTPLVLAARFTGPARSAFEAPPQATLDAQPEDREPLKHVAEAVEPINIIVVADTDMLADRAWIQLQRLGQQRLGQPFANNADFLVNALDNLRGDEALIGLRGRGVAERTFTLIEDMQKAAEGEFRAEERRLSEELERAEARLQELTGQDQPATQVLSTEQERAIQAFRAQVLETRARLREVQRSLRSGVESLKTSLIQINILVMPVLLAAAAVGLAARRRRRARALAV